MIAKRQKEVAEWIIQFDARKIVYLDIPQQITIYGENATEFIKERFIDSPPKCEKAATMDDINNGKSTVPPDTPESVTNQNFIIFSEPEQVTQDVDQNSVSENSGERDEIGENNHENKSDELNAQNTFESGTFAITLDTLLFFNIIKC